MHIRPMIQADVTAVAAVGAAAFINSELSVWLYPHRYDYRASWEYYILQGARRRMHEPGIQSFVAVLDHRDIALGPPGLIVGYAYWERLGEPGCTTTLAWRLNKTSFGDWFERSLLKAEGWYHDHLRLNWSASRANAEAFYALGSPYDDSFRTHVPNRWHLQTCAVHPNFQRKGVGQLLVEWGLVTARREGVPVVLVSSLEGSQLYSKLGFNGITWAPMGTLGIEQGWKGGRVMIYDPEERHTREATGKERTMVISGVTKDVDVVWKTEA